MPLDAPRASADLAASEPQFFEPQLPDPESEDWQEILRRIFATESGIWQRRGVASWEGRCDR
jgi:hypothetical protein